MSWYRTGTVAVTNGSTVVTGTGTMFAANNRTGDAFVGPDGKVYEVTNIPTEATLSISPAYIGTTASGQAYAIAPMQGYVKASADRLRQATDDYGYKLENLGTLAEQDADDVVIIGGSATGLSALGVSGNQTFSGAGRRIKGDMSATTLSDRLMFQTSVSGGASSLAVMPDASGVSATLQAFSSATVADCPRVQLTSTPSQTILASSNFNSSGTFVPLLLQTGGSTRAIINTTGELGIGLTADTACKLQVSNGIKVGNTVNANPNVFDWSEKGNFTPTIFGSTTAGVASGGSITGQYYRLGNIVFCRITASWTTHSGSGFIRIGAHPFTNSANAAVGKCSYSTLTVGAGKELAYYLSPSSQTAIMVADDPAGGGRVSVNLDGSASFECNFFYFV